MVRKRKPSEVTSPRALLRIRKPEPDQWRWGRLSFRGVRNRNIDGAHLRQSVWMNGHPPSGIPIEIERPEPGPHLATIEIDGREVKTLADLPPLRDRLLFVGLSP